MLKEVGILNLTDYLENIKNQEEVQGIISDVLDCEDLQLEDLLVEVISSKSSEVINLQFHECFHSYVIDIIDRPELIKNEFIPVIEQRLSSEVYQNLLIRLINELLIHELHKTSDVKQVFTNQKEWNVEFNDHKFNMIARILRKVLLNHSETLIQHLLQKIHSEANINWFFVLLIIRQLDKKPEKLSSKLTFYFVARSAQSGPIYNLSSLVL